MHILLSELYRTVHQYPQIVIYGAGQYARIVYPMLKKMGLKKQIVSFAVTNSNGNCDMDGVPVRAVDEVSVRNQKDCLVLVATGKAYEDEIVHTLAVLKFANIIKLTDYIMQDDDFDTMLESQSDEYFLKSVTEEYLWNNVSSIDEFRSKKKEIESCVIRKKEIAPDGVNQNLIVFISGNLTPRSKKIISALVKKNYQLIVVQYGSSCELIISELLSYHMKFVHCEDVYELFCRAMTYQPLVYFCEPIWGDCSVPETMIRHKDLFGKIVFATYDVLNDGYVQISDRQKLSEQYCLENADGVVWRWFSKQFLEEKKGFVYKGKSIQFLDYCEEFDAGNCSSVDSTLKLCFAIGGIDGHLDRSVLKNDGQYVEPARIDTIIGKIGNRTDCIFDVFIGECSDEDRKKLDQLEKNYSNFRVFYGTRHRDLIRSLSAYDYGCLLWTDGQDIPDLESIDNIHYGSNYNNSEANVCFDYLSAGLPVISTRSKKQCEYLDKFGVLVKMNVANLDVDYLRKNRTFFHKNVANAKAALLIDNHIRRLTDFFEKL